MAFARFPGNNSEHKVGEWGGDNDQKIASPPPRRLCDWLDMIDKVSEYTGKCLSWLIVFIIIIYCTEVLLRYVFNSPTTWAHESTTYFFGAYFMLGGAYALRMGKMVKVDIWVNRLNPRTRCIVDGVMSIITLLFLLVLLYHGTELAYSSVMKNERSSTPWGPPVYPLKITVVAGAGLLFLQALSQTIRDFIFAFRGSTTS